MNLPKDRELERLSLIVDSVCWCMVAGGTGYFLSHLVAAALKGTLMP